LQQIAGSVVNGMKLLLLLTTGFGILFPKTDCLSSGPPASVCRSMVPLGHPGRGQSFSDLGFSLAVDQDVINRGQRLFSE